MTDRQTLFCRGAHRQKRAQAVKDKVQAEQDARRALKRAAAVEMLVESLKKEKDAQLVRSDGQADR
jgi:hypothetical protein